MKTKERYYSAGQIAQAIGLSAGAIRAMAREGKLKFKRRGLTPRGKMLFPESEYRRLRSVYQFNLGQIAR